MAIDKKAPTQRTLNALETKHKLFRTALSLFAQYGYSKVTVEDITRYSGLSKGTFYAYFPSKESVLLEQFRLIDAHYEQVFKSLPENVSASKRILILIDAMCDYCSNVVGVAPLQVIYSNQISSSNTIEILNNTERPVYQIFRDISARGKKTGEIPKTIEDNEFAELMMRFARGLIYDWCMYNGTFDLQKEGLRYFTLLTHFLNNEAKNPSQNLSWGPLKFNDEEQPK